MKSGSLIIAIKRCCVLSSFKNTVTYSGRGRGWHQHGPLLLYLQFAYLWGMVCLYFCSSAVRVWSEEWTRSLVLLFSFACVLANKTSKLAFGREKQLSS